MCGTMFPRNLSFADDLAARWALDAITMRPSRGRRYTRSTYQTRALKGALSEVIDDTDGDTWTHLDAARAFDRRKPHDCEIVAHDRLIDGNPRLANATWTNDKPSTFIKWLSFEENVDRVVGHDSYGLARSDGADHIAKWRAHIGRRISLIKIDVFLFFF